MVRREPAIHLQERRQLILLFDLLDPLKLRLDAIFHAQPAEVLDVHIVRSFETARSGRTLARKYRSDSLANRALSLVLWVQDRAQPGKYRLIRAVSLVADDQRHRHRRDETRIRDLHHMFSGAQLL